MNLHLLHTISGVLILLFFAGKTALHYYLDARHNRSSSFLYSLLHPLPYLQHYHSAVTEAFRQTKRICNWLLAFSLVSLLLNLLLGLLILAQ